MSGFICPYCFEKANTNAVFFQCINPKCSSLDPQRSALLYDIPVNQLDESQIQKYPTVFRDYSSNALFRLFGCSNPDFAFCPECEMQTSIRVCPKCHSPFPQGVDNLSNLMIAIVGAKETGKSHFIAVLIQKIRSLYKAFNWTLSANDDETMNLYKKHFYNPLYKSNPPRILEVTQSARGNAVVKKPLLYSLGIIRGKRYQSITLAFFDTAGEDMDSEDQMRLINRYIYNASGIILLLDPLQLPGVRKKLKSEHLPHEGNAYVGDIINRVANLIRNGRSIPRNTRIRIPLAVALSKIDMLQDMIGKSSVIFENSRHRGSFNLREFRNINGHIRGWISHFDEEKSFLQQTNDFMNAGFFGISALGGNPDANGFLPFSPRPIRIEDPFLWLLWKNNFIQGKEL
ncbi:MAG: hypothetical protein Q4C95_11950 [Planctomycetia bacterium]|nr:hypothetical protein [Planctomycetia bacterium]